MTSDPGTRLRGHKFRVQSIKRSASIALATATSIGAQGSDWMRSRRSVPFHLTVSFAAEDRTNTSKRQTRPHARALHSKGQTLPHNRHTYRAIQARLRTAVYSIAVNTLFSITNAYPNRFDDSDS